MTPRALAAALAVSISTLSLAQTPPQFAPAAPGVPFWDAPRFIGTGVDLADVTGDGLLDIVTGDVRGEYPYFPEFNVFVNLGKGAFAPPVTSFVATEGNDILNLAIALGDLNADGRADLVTTRLAEWYPPDGNRPNLAVLFGQPDGTFCCQLDVANSSSDRFMRQPRGRNLVVAEMTGDGIPDILSTASVTSFSVLPGNNDGTFDAPIQSGSGYAEIMLAGDIDGDGDLDALGVWNSGSDSRAKITVSINRNNGAGHLTSAGNFELDCRINIVHTGQARAFLTDVTGDAKADLIVFGEHGGQTGAGGIYVRRSNGDATFTSIFRETRSQDSNDTATIVVGDFDGDNDVDIAKIPNAGAPGEIMINDGAGGFAQRAPLSFNPSYLVAAAAGHVVGSPLPDLVIYDDPFDDQPTHVRWLENITPAGAECRTDFSGDAIVNSADVGEFINAWFEDLVNGTLNADFDANGIVNSTDVGEFINVWFEETTLGCS